MERKDEAMRSLQTAFRRSIRRRAVDAAERYRMLAPGDHIAVCISGGKDSMLLAKVMQDLQMHGELPFSLSFLAMDPGYSAENRKLLEHNAAQLGIPLKIFDTRVLHIAQRHAKNPCFLCAKMRRGWLYAQAQAIGCNKIALGHHFDDAAETVLMAMLYGGQVQSMLPKLKSRHYPGMQLIRPLFLVHEADIAAWAAHCGLHFLDCACGVAEKRGSLDSKRALTKALLAELCRENPQIKQNILNSVKNIDVTRVLGYHIGQEQHTFLEREENE